MSTVRRLLLPALVMLLTPALTPTAEPPGPRAEKVTETTFPLTVTGTATDLAGKPVPGATVYVLAVNGSLSRVVAHATTDREGRYWIADARLPVNGSPVAGQFQVCGTAPGYGFTWDGVRAFLPAPPPKDGPGAFEEGDAYVIHPRQPFIPLIFGPPAALQGRFIDEDGRPVEDVKVHIRFCDWLRPPLGFGRGSLHPDFEGIEGLPAAVTTATTDRTGRFRLDGLPKDAIFRVVVEHPDHAELDLYAATARPPLPANIEFRSSPDVSEKNPVLTGDLNATLPTLRRVAVQVVWGGTGKPAAGVTVFADQDGLIRTLAYGTTDRAGGLTLRLPPGEYRVGSDPPHGSDHIRTYGKLTVAKEPAEQKLAFRMKAGCAVLLEAVDVDTGQGVPKVEFRCKAVGAPGGDPAWWARGYVERPESDATGRCRGVVAPGKFRVWVDDDLADYDPLQKEGETVDCPEGGTVKVRIKLRSK